MGVDYNGVGGIGLEVTNEIKKKLVVANDGDFCGCMDTLLDDLEFEYREAGDGNYSGEENTYYIMVEGENLREIIENSEPFIERLSNMGIIVTFDNLKVIEDLRVW
jgi:hypothetical protein